MRRAQVAVWLAMIASGSVTSRAHALQDYAMAIAEELVLAEQPSCLFCHARADDGDATDTPFNDALKDLGFTRRRGVPSLLAALDALERDDVDSDGDGVGDVDELRAGANPNDERDAGMPSDDFAGCAIAPHPRDAPFSALCWPLIVAWLWVSRRRTPMSRAASKHGLECTPARPAPTGLPPAARAMPRRSESARLHR